jgi:transforming growth factor-beta-induced protein
VGDCVCPRASRSGNPTPPSRVSTPRARSRWWRPNEMAERRYGRVRTFRCAPDCQIGHARPFTAAVGTRVRLDLAESRAKTKIISPACVVLRSSSFAFSWHRFENASVAPFWSVAVRFGNTKRVIRNAVTSLLHAQSFLTHPTTTMANSFSTAMAATRVVVAAPRTAARRGAARAPVRAAAAPKKAAAAAPKKAEMKDIVDTAVGAGSFTTLAAALGAAGLVDTLKSAGPFTVFAPTDDAFAKLPKGTVEDLLKPENKAKLAGILTYHVVAGKVMSGDVVKLKEAATVNGAMVKIDASAGVKINDATVTTADIECKNGVIHIIDSVILPPAAPELKDIVDTAVGAGSFTTLAAALGAAGLVDTLKSAGPFTVFAPTDDAFAKLPKGTVEDLLKPENKAKLAGILTYHVVAGKVMSGDVVKLKEAATVNGAKVTIDASTGVKVDGATVTTADIECKNGVIHIIDSVILPK